MPEPDRFWSRVEVGLCWEWTGPPDKDGYGRFSVDSRTKKRVHRYVWELLVGPIAPGLQLDHLCRNKRCCNPDHLEPVTARVNILRAPTIQARNASKVVCLRGHEFDSLTKRGQRQCSKCAAIRHQLRKAVA